MLNLSTPKALDFEYIPTTGCWEVISHSAKGEHYPKLKFAGKTEAAHRISYESFYGEIPRSMKICHKCDNRKCINPEHLFLGTDAANNADMRSKGREYKGPLGKLQVRSIYSETGSTRDIASRTGVSVETARRIRNGEIYKAYTYNI